MSQEVDFKNNVMTLIYLFLNKIKLNFHFQKIKKGYEGKFKYFNFISFIAYINERQQGNTTMSKARFFKSINREYNH